MTGFAAETAAITVQCHPILTAIPALTIKPMLKSGKPLSSHFPAAFQPQETAVNL